MAIMTTFIPEEDIYFLAEDALEDVVFTDVVDSVAECHSSPVDIDTIITAGAEAQLASTTARLIARMVV